MQIDSYYFTYDSLLLTYKTPCICHMYITTRRVPLRCSGRTPGESLQSEMPIKVVFGIFRKNVDFAYFNTRIAKLWQSVTNFAFLCIIFWICLNSFLMFLGSIPTIYPKRIRILTPKCFSVPPRFLHQTSHIIKIYRETLFFVTVVVKFIKGLLM